MDLFISTLREKRKIRDEERSKLENVQAVEHESRKRELEDLKEERLKAMETIVNNLNIITGHRHTISKVVHQSEECVGLPISNKHHRQTLEFLSDAIKLVGDQQKLLNNLKLENSVDPKILNYDVQYCAQSSADSYKGMKSSVDRVETLMHNIHIIGEQYCDEEPCLETSIFDI